MKHTIHSINRAGTRHGRMQAIIHWLKSPFHAATGKKLGEIEKSFITQLALTCAVAI